MGVREITNTQELEEPQGTEDTSDSDKGKRALETSLRAEETSDPDEGNRDEDTEDRKTKHNQDIGEQQVKKNIGKPDKGKISEGSLDHIRGLNIEQEETLQEAELSTSGRLRKKPRAGNDDYLWT